MTYTHYCIDMAIPVSIEELDTLVDLDWEIEKWIRMWLGLALRTNYLLTHLAL